MKAAAVDPAATVTDAGNVTVTPGATAVVDTTVPPEGAAAVSVTVHDADAGPVNVPGVHTIAESCAGVVAAVMDTAPETIVVVTGAAAEDAPSAFVSVRAELRLDPAGEICKAALAMTPVGMTLPLLP